MDQMWRKKQLKWLVWNFKGLGARFEDEREKNEREKNYQWRQTRGTFGTNATQSYLDLPNIMLEGGIGWLDEYAYILKGIGVVLAYFLLS
jgi:hypothetical protein